VLMGTGLRCADDLAALGPAPIAEAAADRERRYLMRPPHSFTMRYTGNPRMDTDPVRLDPLS